MLEKKTVWSPKAIWATSLLFIAAIVIAFHNYDIFSCLILLLALRYGIKNFISCINACKKRQYTQRGLFSTILCSSIVALVCTLCGNYLLNNKTFETLFYFKEDGFLGVWEKILLGLYSWYSGSFDLFFEQSTISTFNDVTIKYILTCLFITTILYTAIAIIAISCFIQEIKTTCINKIRIISKKPILDIRPMEGSYGWIPLYPIANAILTFIALISFLHTHLFLGTLFAICAILSNAIGMKETRKIICLSRYTVITTIITAICSISLIWLSTASMDSFLWSFPPKSIFNYDLHAVINSCNIVFFGINEITSGNLDIFYQNFGHSSITKLTLISSLTTFIIAIFFSVYFIGASALCIIKMTISLCCWLVPSKPDSSKKISSKFKLSKFFFVHKIKLIHFSHSKQKTNVLQNREIHYNKSKKIPAPHEQNVIRKNVLKDVIHKTSRFSIFASRQSRFINNLINLIELNNIRSQIKHFQVDGTIIGNGSQDFTKDYKAYSLNINGEAAQLVDIPGIEGKEELYKDIISRALAKAHLVCYVARESKGLEESTLSKVNDYLRKNVTEVIGIHNIPLQPQKEYDGNNYIHDISAKINEAIKSNSNIDEKLGRVVQGNLYRGTFGIAILPGLCAIARNNGETTFEHPSLHQDNDAVRDSLQTLRRQQNTFLMRASDTDLLKVSHLTELRNFIIKNCESAPNRIKKAALVRLKSTLENEYIATIRNQKKLIGTFKNQVTQRSNIYISNLEDASYRVKRNLPSAVQSAVFEFYREEILRKILYPHIERNKKIIESEVESIVSSRQTQLQTNFQNRISQAMQSSINDFAERVKAYTDDYVRGMKLDIGNLSVEIPSISIDSFNMGELGNVAITIGGYILSGMAIGSFIPGIGNLIGGIVGGIVGAIVSFFKFFESDASKIRKCKNQAAEAIDDKARETWCSISNKISSHAEKLASCLNKNIAEAKYQIEAATKSYDLINDLEQKMTSVSKGIQNNINQIKVA